MYVRRIPLLILILLCGGARASACLWDYDTLRDERRGMPGIAEVLAGQWEQHSAFFYRHRVEAMTQLLATHPDDGDAADNLAVADAKLGNDDAAISLMLDKEKRHPGQYTTASNLGTFYMFKGDLPRAIEWLTKALAINPNAHFGREAYQLQLAEFLEQVKIHPELRDDDFLNLRKAGSRNDDESFKKTGGGDYLKTDVFLELGNEKRFANFHLKPNVFDGVVGMIRFGTTESADLYFALGDLLAAHGQRILAYRAFQRAIDLNYPRSEAVRKSMEIVRGVEVPQAAFAPSLIATERAAAGQWVAEYQAFEDGLIRAGKSTDDEANYAPFYATHSRHLTTRALFVNDLLVIYGKSAFVIAGFAGLIGFEIWRTRRRKRRSAEHPASSATLPTA